MAGGAAGRAPEHWEHNPKADVETDRWGFLKLQEFTNCIHIWNKSLATTGLYIYIFKYVIQLYTRYFWGCQQN